MGYQTINIHIYIYIYIYIYIFEQESKISAVSEFGKLMNSPSSDVFTMEQSCGHNSSIFKGPAEPIDCFCGLFCTLFCETLFGATYTVYTQGLLDP